MNSLQIILNKNNTINHTVTQRTKIKRKKKKQKNTQKNNKNKWLIHTNSDKKKSNDKIFKTKSPYQLMSL